MAITEVQRGDETTDTATSVITLSGGVSTGNRAVVLLYYDNGPNAIASSAVDSKGNTWAINVTTTDGSRACSIVSAQVTSALAASDTITVTWTSAPYGQRIWLVHSVPSTGALNQTAADSTTYGTTVSLPATTTATAHLIGILANNQPSTYSGSNWTAGTVYIGRAGDKVYPVYTESAAAGSQNPGGTLSPAGSQFNAWAGYAVGSVAPLTLVIDEPDRSGALII